MIINHNMSALYANRQVKFNEIDLNKDIEKLSTGMRINSGGDDASGLAVSEKLRSQIRGLNQADRNIENAVSFIQTTEGYLAETQDIMHRVRELAVQSANGIYTQEDRMQIQVEVSQLVDEVNRIASHAQFNGMNMLTGRFANPARGGTATAEMFFQVGANMDQRKQVFIGTMTAAGTRAAGDFDLHARQGQRGHRKRGQRLEAVSKQRADLGAYQNRFEMAAKGVAVAAENMQAAESLIRDTDMAAQMVDYTKNADPDAVEHCDAGAGQPETQDGPDSCCSRKTASGFEPFPTEEASGRRFFCELRRGREVAHSLPFFSHEYSAQRKRAAAVWQRLSAARRRQDRHLLRKADASTSRGMATESPSIDAPRVPGAPGRHVHGGTRHGYGNTWDSQIESRAGRPPEGGAGAARAAAAAGRPAGGASSKVSRQEIENQAKALEKTFLAFNRTGGALRERHHQPGHHQGGRRGNR